MKQKLSGLFIALALLAISAGAAAQTWYIGSPNAGDVTATLVADGTLTISGTGDMEDWSFAGQPWNSDENPRQYAIKKVVIGNGVTNIGSWAFMWYESLTEVIIPNSVERIGGMSFYGCTGLTELTIPNSVTSIDSDAFFGCYNLEEITVGDNLTGIESIFGSYDGNIYNHLIAIHVSASNANYSSEGGILFNKNKTKLVLYPAGKQGTYTIPSSVTNIGRGAFEYCGGLTEVTIPNSVTEIEGYAFQECSGLEDITIPSSVERVGNNAFDACINLTEITFLGNRPTFGSDFFSNIPSFQLTLYCPNGNTTWDSFSYSGVYVERLPGVSVSVTFNSNEGSPVATQSVNSGEKVIYPLKPVKEDYIFIGWYNNDTEFDFATPITESITLMAKWQQDLTAEYETLTTQNTSLQAQVNNLTEENETLEGQVTALTEEKMELNEEIAAIQQQLEGCATSTVRSAELYSSLNIYPNPVINGELRIESGKLKEGEVIAIYDLSGAQVAVYQATGEQTTIDVSQLTSGTYLLKAGSYAAKLVKQ